MRHTAIPTGSLRIARMAVAAIGVSGLGQAAAQDGETRRQVGSELIDAVYGLDGLGVNIGQTERKPPLDHTRVPVERRAGPGFDPNLHALEVAGIMVSNHPIFRGMAHRAELWMDDYRNNNMGTRFKNVLDAVRWLTTDAPHARVVNFSVGFGDAKGTSELSLGLDWRVLQDDFLFVKSAGNKGTTGHGSVTLPGAMHNGLAVGNTISPDYIGRTVFRQGPVNHRFSLLAPDSSYGTAHGIPKPELVAPGGRTRYGGFIMATKRDGFDANPNRVGTSYAAPHVSGVAAQLYQQFPSADHRLMKAVLMNAADKTVRDRDNQPWEAMGVTDSHGLDNQLGTGQLNAWGSAQLLSGGDGRRIGWHIGTTRAGSGWDLIEDLPVGPDSRLVATVVWDRKVTRNGTPPNERYDLDIDRQPHYGISWSTLGHNVTQDSPIGSVQHINTITTPGQSGNYTLRIENNGAVNGDFGVAYVVSPVDANPGPRDVFFTVRDRIHKRRAPPFDRILEGRDGTAVRAEAVLDGRRRPAGVESAVWRSNMNVDNTLYQDDRDLGIRATANLVDDGVNALSFGRDNIRKLERDGGRVWFSVDSYATGLSPYGVNNPQTGVFDEATIVNEAAGDIFQSHLLLPGAAPLFNMNRRIKNIPNDDSLHPAGQLNMNTTFADSYYLGLTGPRLSDNEDDLNGLEGLGGVNEFDPSLDLLDERAFTFFSLDRDSPTARTNRADTGDILVARRDRPGMFKRYARAFDLGLNADDNIDALLIEHLSGLDSDGWPVFDSLVDLVIFSVDRDSTGRLFSTVFTEHVQGEVASDLFQPFGGNNLLFLESTDLGLQEVALGGGMNWLTDNLDALDLPDVAPTPATVVLLAIGAGVCFRRRRAA